MNTLADIIADIRLEMTDEQSTRWTDAQALRVIGKAFRRVNHLLHRNDVEFGRSRATITTMSGQAQYALPADFMVDYGLFRSGQDRKIPKQSDDSWEQLDNPAELTAWIIRGGSLFVAAAPVGVEDLTLVYWPLLDTSAWTTATTSPYGGKLDDIVAEYAALRLKNIDEMDVGLDSQLLQDMENNVLNTYAMLDPTIVTRRGWLV